MSHIILAIDVSSVAMGFAYGMNDGRILAAGVFRYKGETFHRWGRIRDNAKDLSWKIAPGIVKIEAPFPSKRSSMEVLLALYGAMACCVEGLRSVGSPEIRMVQHGSWRSKILGNFPKGKSPTGDQKKALTRDRLIQDHPYLGNVLPVQDNGFDASDACGIWLSGL